MSGLMRNFVNKLCGPKKRNICTASSQESDPSTVSLISYFQNKGFQSLRTLATSKVETVLTAIDPTGKSVKIVTLNLARVKNRKTFVSSLNSLFAQFREMSHPDVAKYLECYFQNELETFVVIQDYPAVYEQLVSPKVEAEYKLAVYRYLNIVKETSNQRLQSVVIGSQSFKIGQRHIVKLDHFLAEEITRLLRNTAGDTGITIEDPDAGQKTPAVTVRNILFEAIMNFKVSDSFISFVKLLDRTKTVESMLSHPFFADLRNQNSGNDARVFKIELPLLSKEEEHNAQGSGLRNINLTTDNSQPGSKITSPTYAMSKLNKGFSSASTSKNPSGALQSERRKIGDGQEYFGFDQSLSQSASGVISSTKETPRGNEGRNSKVHSPLQPSKFSRQASAEQNQVTQPNQQRILQEAKPLKLLTPNLSTIDTLQPNNQLHVKQTLTEPSNRLTNKTFSAQLTLVHQHTQNGSLDIRRLSNTSQTPSQKLALAEVREFVNESKDSNIQMQVSNIDKITPKFPMNSSNSSQTERKNSNQSDPVRGQFQFPQPARQANTRANRNYQIDLPPEADLHRYSIHEIHSTETIELDAGIPFDQKLSLLQTQAQPVKRPPILASESADENFASNAEPKIRVTTPTGKSILKTGRSKSNSRVRFADNLIIE